MQKHSECALKPVWSAKKNFSSRVFNNNLLMLLFFWRRLLLRLHETKPNSAMGRECQSILGSAYWRKFRTSKELHHPLLLHVGESQFDGLRQSGQVGNDEHAFLFVPTQESQH